jgi:hypothetical protein
MFELLLSQSTTTPDGSPTLVSTEGYVLFGALLLACLIAGWLVVRGRTKMRQEQPTVVGTRTTDEPSIRSWLGVACRSPREREGVMSMRRALVAVALAPALLAAGTPASARVWTVGDQVPGCPPPDFLSVQDAIDAAAPYDTISVCSGAYFEDLAFAGRGKSHISVNGDTRGFVQVQGGADGPAIQITGRARDVQLSNLEVMDVSAAPAIEIAGRSRDIRLSNLFLWCTGVSVRVGRGATAALDRLGFGGEPDGWCWGADAQDRARVDITNSQGAFGVRATGRGTHVRAWGNQMFGAPGRGSPPATGALIRDGARAVLQHNEFKWFLHPDPSHDDSWRSMSGVIRVENTARVVIGDRGPNSTGDGNVIHDSSSDGVVVRGSRRLTVAGNAISGLFGRGIAVDADSRHNRFRNNQLSGNLLFRTQPPPGQEWFGPQEDFDCRDASTGRRTAGTANTWSANASDAGALAASPAGLCAPS